MRIALRSLKKTPLFSVVTIASLGFGLALAATTLAITNAYLLGSLPYPEGERLHHVMYAPPGPYEPRGMSAIDWTALSDVVDATVVATGDVFFVGDGASAHAVRVTRVSPGFLKGLGVRPILGQAFSERDFHAGGPEVALLGHDVWRSRFNADPNIVGREIRASSENRDFAAVNVRVVGVLPPGFWFGRSSGSPIEMLVPLRSPARTYMVRLAPGVPRGFAEQRITAEARRVGSDFRPDWTGVRLESVHARYVEGLRPLLFGINAASAVVLVLVCANVAILNLLRTLRRQKEVAVRVALGAGRRHLLRMLLAEAGLLCLAASAVAIGITIVALKTLAPVIEARLGKPPPAGPAAFAVGFDVILAVGGVGVVIVLALALLPLWAPQRWALGEMLRRAGLAATDGPSMRHLRSTLIALEIAGALVLLAGGGLMLRTVLNLVQTDLGFDARNVARMAVTLPSRYRDAAVQAQFFRRLAERLEGLRSPAAVGSSFPPFYEPHQRRFESDTSDDNALSIGGLTVGAGYFQVHGIPLLQGREFTLDDRLESDPVAIVSESLARQLWPGSSALGRRIRGIEVSEPTASTGPWRTVVGVARDVRQTYADTDLRDVYFPQLQSPTRFGSVQWRTDRAGGLAPTKITEIVNELEPFARTGEPRLLAAEDQQLARAQFLSTLVGGFAAFATSLALLGIYGVTAYAARQRERELAIRVALGATNSRIARMFLRESAWVFGAGIMVGLVATLGSTRVLTSQVHGVRAFDPFTVAGAGVFLLTCAVFATWWPVRRAASGDVTTALKTE